MRTTARLSARLSERSIRPAGFTLVELLLVIAIVVIIVTLILISLRQLQTRARATACLSNQRQIALANNAYAADNNGRFVSPRTDSLPPPRAACAAPPIRGSTRRDRARSRRASRP